MPTVIFIQIYLLLLDTYYHADDMVINHKIINYTITLNTFIEDHDLNTNNKVTVIFLNKKNTLYTV